MGADDAAPLVAVFFPREVNLQSLGRDPMDEVACLELGFAKDVGGPLADEQARQGKEVVAGLLADAFRQALGLDFLLRGQLDECHGSPRKERDIFRADRLSLSRVQRFYQLSSCTHPGVSRRLFSLLSA